jgi:hypothetical protein
LRDEIETRAASSATATIDEAEVHRAEYPQASN